MPARPWAATSPSASTRSPRRCSRSTCATRLPGWAYYSEDRGLQGAADPELILIVDPIDGTRPAAAGFEIGLREHRRGAGRAGADHGRRRRRRRPGDQERRPLRRRAGAGFGMRRADGAPHRPSRRRRATDLESLFWTLGFRGRPAAARWRASLEELIDALVASAAPSSTSARPPTRSPASSPASSTPTSTSVRRSSPPTRGPRPSSAASAAATCCATRPTTSPPRSCSAARPGVPMATPTAPRWTAAPLLGSRRRLPDGLHRVGQRDAAGRADRPRCSAASPASPAVRRDRWTRDVSNAARGHALRAPRRRRRAVSRLSAPLRHRARASAAPAGRARTATACSTASSTIASAAWPPIPSRRSRCSTSSRAPRCCRSARWAATSPAPTARTGRSPTPTSAAGLADLRALPVEQAAGAGGQQRLRRRGLDLQRAHHLDRVRDRRRARRPRARPLHGDGDQRLHHAEGARRRRAAHRRLPGRRQGLRRRAVQAALPGRPTTGPCWPRPSAPCTSTAVTSRSSPTSSPP